jgi:hypothetical protein
MKRDFALHLSNKQTTENPNNRKHVSLIYGYVIKALKMPEKLIDKQVPGNMFVDKKM